MGFWYMLGEGDYEMSPRWASLAGNLSHVLSQPIAEGIKLILCNSTGRE